MRMIKVWYICNDIQCECSSEIQHSVVIFAPTIWQAEQWVNQEENIEYITGSCPVWVDERGIYCHKKVDC